MNLKITNKENFMYAHAIMWAKHMYRMTGDYYTKMVITCSLFPQHFSDTVTMDIFIGFCVYLLLPWPRQYLISTHGKKDGSEDYRLQNHNFTVYSTKEKTNHP